MTANAWNLPARLARTGVAAALALALVGCADAQDAPLYKDAAAPVDVRVEDLLGRMTLDEKVAQITTI